MTKDGETKSVTIKTVAKDAEVSVAAVSKVLRNAYGVSESLRNKVNKSIEKLNYRPKVAARGMRGKTYSIGVVMGDIRNSFLPDILDGIQDKLENTSFRPLIGVSKYDSRIETRIIDIMMDHQVDGVVMVSPHLETTMIDKFARLVPTVVIAHHDNSSCFDSVNTDDEEGAKLVVEHFVKSGFTNIVMQSVEESRPYSVVTHRENGFCKAIKAAGIDDQSSIVRLIGRLDNRVDRIPSDYEPIIGGKELPQAIFSWSDLDAVFLCAAAKEMNIKIPEELSVIGFDNSKTAQLPQISLSSINQSGFKLGDKASELLLERIEGRKESRHEMIMPELILRKTSL